MIGDFPPRGRACRGKSDRRIIGAMDTFRIECFLKAAELGNMTKAAERMNVTQPAMSFQIRELERELQLSLFERERSGIRLTEAGKVMRDGLVRIMDNYHRLLANARACAVGKQRLTIGYHGIVNWAGIHRFIAGFSGEHPDIEVAVLQQQWRELADYLEIGALDVAFLETKELKNRPALRSLPLFQENTCFALEPTHPLANRKKVCAEDLAGETILMNNHESDCMRELIERLYRSGLPRENFRFFDQLDVTLAMAAAGQGLTSLPVSFRLENSALSYVEFESPYCGMEYSLAWSATSESRAVELFCEAARAASWPY